MHEPVIVVAPKGQHAGHLFRGRDGLPELVIEQQRGVEEPFRPARLPAAWYLQPTKGQVDTPLLEAWDKIEAIQQDLREAEREARTERDDIDEAKAYLEVRGERR